MYHRSQLPAIACGNLLTSAPLYLTWRVLRLHELFIDKYEVRTLAYFNHSNHGGLLPQQLATMV